MSAKRLPGFGIGIAVCIIFRVMNERHKPPLAKGLRHVECIHDTRDPLAREHMMCVVRRLRMYVFTFVDWTYGAESGLPASAVEFFRLIRL